MANISQCSSYFKRMRFNGQMRFILAIIYLIIYYRLIIYIIRNGVQIRVNTGKATQWDMTFGSFANIDIRIYLINIIYFKLIIKQKLL